MHFWRWGNRFRAGLAFLAILLTLPPTVLAQDEPDVDVNGTETVGEPQPASSEGSAIERRLELEKKTTKNPFAILPYKPNYILPVTYNTTPNKSVYQGSGDNINQIEIKFQLSFRIPVWNDIFGDNGTLSAGYTQLSFWQAYNTKNSSPFRETNFEPELFLSFENDLDLLGVRNRIVSFGFVHQSNGRGGDLSRSWNRVYGLFAFERGNLYFALKPWYRIPEDRADDDNPDIDKYMGNGEIYAVYTLGKQRFGMMLRNNLREDNRGAVQLDWSFPLLEKVHGYVQYFNGYGESLIDYNHSVNRIGAGVVFAYWL